MKKNLLILAALWAILSCGSQPQASDETQPHVPVIGISCSRSSNGATSLASAYTESVMKAGGIAVVIPTLDSPAQAEAVLAVLDGIVFSGGEDLDPAWFGEEILNETVEIDHVRDYSDSLLVRAAQASGKPVLAICRGEQLMNVLLGGSLYQDLPSQLGVRHGGGVRHKIGVEEGSLLAELFGPDSLEVNSFHHQAVKDPGEGVRVTARSVDGVVEAFEAEGVVAVQFHPEKMLQGGEGKWLALFEWFVEHCR